VDFSLRLGPLNAGLNRYLSPIFAPFVDLAEAGEDVGPFVSDFIHGLGFHTFQYWMALVPHNGGATQAFVVTNETQEWIKLYDERAYIEVDPRVQNLLDTTIPAFWDQHSFIDQSARVGEFLAMARFYGIARGVVVPIRDSYGHSGMMTLNCGIQDWTVTEKAETTKRLGDIALFARYFHELFQTAVRQRKLAPVVRFSQLSVRERECMFLIANRLTFEDVAARLQISIKTLEFHLNSIRAKLNVTRMQDAISKVAGLGEIGK